jgi:shikimate kinase
MNLILFGFKNCGKTTLGRRVAQHLNRPFIDTDRLVEQMHYERTGVHNTCREIAMSIGEAGFRALEVEALEQLNHTKNAIVSLGGGLILNPQSAAFLAKLGRLVYLKVNKDTLKRRTLSRPRLPSYLDPLDPEGSFEQMYNKRRPIYEKIPALSVDLDDKKQDQIVEELCALIHTLEDKHG